MKKNRITEMERSKSRFYIYIYIYIYIYHKLHYVRSAIKNNNWNMSFETESCLQEEKGPGQKGNDAKVYTQNVSFVLN